MLEYVVAGVNFDSVTVHDFLYIRIPKHHGIKDEREEPQYNTINNQDTNDIGDYEEDLTEQRIEGIEALVEQLSKTVLELNDKVFQLNDNFVLNLISIYENAHWSCYHD